MRAIVGDVTVVYPSARYGESVVVTTTTFSGHVVGLGEGEFVFLSYIVLCEALVHEFRGRRVDFGLALFSCRGRT